MAIQITRREFTALTGRPCYLAIAVHKPRRRLSPAAIPQQRRALCRRSALAPPRSSTSSMTTTRRKATQVRAGADRQSADA